MSPTNETLEGRHSELLEILSETLSETKGTREEIGSLSTQFALHEQNDHHVHSEQEKRIDKLEGRADASGAHDIMSLKQKLEERKAVEDQWKGRAWAIFATLFLVGFTGLVTHWISTR